MTEKTEIEEAVHDEEQSALEDAAEDVPQAEEGTNTGYEDPISEEYSTDMQNWLGINKRKPDNKIE
jgi:hypothetical protein